MFNKKLFNEIMNKIYQALKDFKKHSKTYKLCAYL